MERIPMTAEGLQRLEGELKVLKSVERPAIIKAIATAREHGDLSENAEYTSAREKQGFIEGRIAELEDIISRTEVIDFSKLTGKIIKFGATVRLAERAREAILAGTFPEFRERFHEAFRDSRDSCEAERA